MSERIAIDLGNVQKTLFLPLWGRAFESKKTHPLLVDKMALEIIGKVDYDFAEIARNTHQLTQMAWIMRSTLMDRVIKKFLSKYPQGTIVNIGCGLDTTFDRIDNGSVRWVDLDLPDVIKLRRTFIHENDRRKFLATSFLDEGWLKDIGASQKVFFMAAGVFYYFEEQVIKDFLIRLASEVPDSEILFDVCSPYGLKVANRVVIKNTGLDEKSFLKWGLSDVKTIPAWDSRLKLLATYYYFRRWNTSLSLRNKLLGLFSDFMKIQYLVHLQLRSTSPISDNQRPPL